MHDSALMISIIQETLCEHMLPDVMSLMTCVIYTNRKLLTLSFCTSFLPGKYLGNPNSTVDTIIHIQPAMMKPIHHAPTHLGLLDVICSLEN